MTPPASDTPALTASTSPLSLQALQELQASMHAAGVAEWDAVGWHYTERLAHRAGQQTGLAQTLLCSRLQRALVGLKARWEAAALPRHRPSAAAAAGKTPAAVSLRAPAFSAGSTSPLAALLQEMAPPLADAGTGQSAGIPHTGLLQSHAWRAESPRVRQFRKQLGQIQVQKQVSQALAQAPQNAGPINSHMLVLRSLGLMRDASPDYLNRFMGYVDTLLCLHEADQGKLPPKKPRR